MTDAFIWRDAHDGDQFYIGVRWEHGAKKFCRVWASVFVDGMADLFDMNENELKVIGTTPVPIKLEMVLPTTKEATA